MSNKKTDISTSVFLVSLLIFVLTIFPATYAAAGSFLTGTAGNPNPDDPSTQPIEKPEPSEFEKWLTILSGGVTIVSGFYGIQKTRGELLSQKLALKKVEEERELQLREIEKLKLELELEKQKKQVRKKRPPKRK